MKTQPDSAETAPTIFPEELAARVAKRSEHYGGKDVSKGRHDLPI